MARSGSSHKALNFLTFLKLSFDKIRKMAQIRIMKELREFQEEQIPNVLSFGPIGNDIYHWEAVITGPEGSLYEGGIFELDCIFPQNYPFREPNFCFKTRIFHPNIDNKGRICSKQLCPCCHTLQWSLRMKATCILQSIISTLSKIDGDHLIGNDASLLYSKNIEEFNRKAREWTHRYAIGVE